MRPLESYYVCPVFWGSVAFYTGFQFGHLKQKKYGTGSLLTCANRWRKDHNVDESNASLSTCSTLFMHTQCYRVCISHVYFVNISRIFQLYCIYNAEICRVLESQREH